MASTGGTRKPESRIELPAVLDLRAAKPLADQLLGLRGNSVKLDASKVEKLGGQCVQVFLSAAKTWEADCADIEVTSPSAAFLAGLQTLGLSPDQLSTGN